MLMKGEERHVMCDWHELRQIFSVHCTMLWHHVSQMATPEIQRIIAQRKLISRTFTQALVTCKEFRNDKIDVVLEHQVFECLPKAVSIYMK